MSDEAFHRRYDDEDTDDIELPPPRRRLTPRGLLIFDAVVRLVVIAYVGTAPVREWMPDVGGWRRPVLYLASFLAALTLLGMCGWLISRRKARRGGESAVPFPRSWAVVAAAGIAIVIVGGWLPQRRINARARQLAAEAARPRTWPSRTVEGYVFGLTTRYVGDSIPYTLTVRCPSHRDCPPRQRLALTLIGSTAHLSDVVPPDALVPDGAARAYHARRSIAAARWFGPAEYVQTDSLSIIFITPE
ncbi:MAG TPA: hypothetical protein VFT45_07135 [Longimicrobium sp.]|nr:hypothetical protein [Longimicrobium sp.]